MKPNAYAQHLCFGVLVLIAHRVRLGSETSPGVSCSFLAPPAVSSFPLSLSLSSPRRPSSIRTTAHRRRQRKSGRKKRAVFLSAAAAAAATGGSSPLPSWGEIENELLLGDRFRAPTPVSIDSVLDPTPRPVFSDARPTLFRERHGWCPYSERVWLALEMSGSIEYDTVRIDNTGHGPRPDYFVGGQTPQIKWPETSRFQGESMDLIREIDERYYAGSLGSGDEAVRDCIDAFRDVFPQRARPSSRAAFLFQYSGEPLWRSTFETTLEKTDQLFSAAGSGGPFFCGSDELTAADIAWAPFLERYRYQLPCLHDGLKPDDPSKYPHLAAWYRAMDALIPAYACRVKGDASSWRKVLTMSGFGNAGVPPDITGNMEELERTEAAQAVAAQGRGSTNDDLKLWQAYASTRPYVATTPHAEAALTIARNRAAILRDTVKRMISSSSSSSSSNTSWKDTIKQHMPKSPDEADEALRGLVSVLLRDGDNHTNEEFAYEGRWLVVGAMATFLDERMCVPRDMGAMPAACIKRVAWKVRTLVS